MLGAVLFLLPRAREKEDKGLASWKKEAPDLWTNGAPQVCLFLSRRARGEREEVIGGDCEKGN